MDQIVDIQVERLAKLLGDRKIAIHLDAKARAWLAATGYDPVYGARPLKRAMQRNLQDPLANLILQGEISDGENVVVSATKRGLVINGHEVEPSGDALGLIGGLEPPSSHAVH
jgi:ATP-dependent Clp protease ATP-binding subunit ClpB